MGPFSIVPAWVIPDMIVTICAIAVAGFILKKEEEPGWILLSGWAAAFILLGRYWWRRSGKKSSVAPLYPLLAMLAALLLLVSPLSQFLLWLGPALRKGSRGEWIMLIA